MSNDNYYQPTLPGLDTQIMLCSCPNPPLDQQYGKFKRPHTFRKGYWNGKQTGKLWYCNSCGRPYWSNVNRPSKFR